MADNIAPAPEKNLTKERLTSLYELIRRMNSVYDLPEMLEFVLDRALSLTGGRRGLLLLNTDDDATPQNIAAVRGEQLEQQDLERILKFVSNTVIRDVLKQGETRLVYDLPTDSRYEGVASQDTLNFKAVRSVLAVPLRAESRPVGLLYIDHPRKEAFGPDELDFLDAFANQAAIAIHRASEHKRQIEELTLLNHLSRSVVQVLDLNEVLTRIVGEVTRMLDVEASSVLLLDDDTGDLVFATSVYDGQRLNIDTRLKPDQGLAGWVMSHGKAIFTNDVTTDSRWYGEVETVFQTRSLLCVPLQINGRSLGVLQALNKRNDNFTKSNITLLTAFAASATIAIENARLFQEAGQARQLRALNDIAMALSSTLDLNYIIEEGLLRTLTSLKVEAGAISLVNQETQTDLLTVQRNHTLRNEPALAATSTQALSDLTVWLLNSGKISKLFDKADLFIVDEQHPPPPALADSSIKSLAVAPLEVSGAIRGALIVMDVSPQTYSAETLNMLTGIGRIISLAAQNSLHYLQTQAQTIHLQYLNEIGSALTRSLELDQVFKVILEGVNTLLQTELTSVFLIDEETNELVLRYSNRGDADIRLPAPWQGIAGWVATHDQPALVNNTHSDPRHLRQVAAETGYKANSILCVPLKVKGQVIGVVEVLNKTGGQEFTHYHQSLLMELTRWAAIALHNARLFDERVQAYERLDTEQQRRIAAETRGAMAAIILDMAHTMNNVVGAIRAWAMSLEYAAIDTPEQPLSQHHSAIQRIRQNTEEALKLMGSMTGPLEPVAVQPVDLSVVLQAAIKSCWWPDSVRLTSHIAAGLPPVQANAERLETVFHNLISNAVQAMTHEGGQVEVTARPVDESRQIEITIADNGPGIPPALQERVFNPGVSSKNGSLGIGLWLVENFVHQFEGRIELDSVPDSGTTFTVTLPAAG